MKNYYSFLEFIKSGNTNVVPNGRFEDMVRKYGLEERYIIKGVPELFQPYIMDNFDLYKNEHVSLFIKTNSTLFEADSHTLYFFKQSDKSFLVNYTISNTNSGEIIWNTKSEEFKHKLYTYKSPVVFDISGRNYIHILNISRIIDLDMVKSVLRNFNLEITFVKEFNTDNIYLTGFKKYRYLDNDSWKYKLLNKMDVIEKNNFKYKRNSYE